MMKKLTVLLLAAMMIFAAACNDTVVEETKSSAPVASSAAKGMNCDVLKEMFEGAGFTDVTLQSIASEDGEDRSVTSVSVGGLTVFSQCDEFDSKSAVIIKYKSVKASDTQKPDDTKPTEPDTKPTEPDTKPTEPDTKPTEPDTKPTEPDTKPTEPDTKPTEPDTKPTEPDTKPTEPDTKPSTGAGVWASKTGKKYHSKPNCSGMKNPTEMTLEQAVAKGLTPCSKCH